MTDNNREDLNRKEEESTRPASARKGRSMVLALISFLLIIVILLFPLSHAVMNVGGGEYTARFSGLGSFELFFAAADGKGFEQIMSTDAYHILEKYGYPDSISLGGRTYLAKELLLLDLRSYSMDIRFPTLFMVGMIIVMLVICILMFTKSLQSVAYERRNSSSGKNKINPLFNSAVKLLAAFVMLLPLFGYMLSHGSYYGVESTHFTISSFGASFGYGVAVFISVVGLLMILASECGGQGSRALLTSHRTEVIVLVLVVLFAIGFATPALSATVEGYSSSVYGEATFGYSYSNLAIINHGDSSAYFSLNTILNEESISKNIINALKYSSERNEGVLIDLLCGIGRFDPSGFFNAFYILNALVLVMLAILGTNMVMRLVANTESSAKAPAIVMTLATLVNLVILFAFTVSAGGSFSPTDAFGASFGIGMAPVVMLVIGVIILFVMSDRSSDDTVTVDRSFDNPDVSYAPYVVIMKKK